MIPRPLAGGSVSRVLRSAPMSRSAVAIAAICVSLAACTREQAPSYDLVVANGRVMDPESGLDAVRHLGIRGGKIEAVSEAPLTGVRTIDASRHVVVDGGNVTAARPGRAIRAPVAGERR